MEADTIETISTLSKSIQSELLPLIPPDLNPNEFDEIDTSFREKISHPEIRQVVKLCLSSLVVVMHHYLFDNVLDDDKVFNGVRMKNKTENVEKSTEVKRYIPIKVAEMFLNELLDKDSYINNIEYQKKSKSESLSSNHTSYWNQFLSKEDREMLFTEMIRPRTKSMDLLQASFLHAKSTKDFGSMIDFDPIHCLFGVTLESIIASCGKSILTYICEQLVLVDFSIVGKDDIDIGSLDGMRRYGLHYANLPTCEGGFALSSFTDTAAVWNVVMATACQKKLNLFPTNDNSWDTTYSSTEEEKKGGFLEETQDQCSLYALKMLPNHLFYSGKPKESFDILNNVTFFTKRLSQIPKLQESTLLHMADYERIRKLSKKEEVSVEDWKTPLLFLSYEVKSHVNESKESHSDKDIADSFYDIARFINKRGCVVEAMDFYECSLEYYRSYHRNVIPLEQDESSRFISLLYDMGHLFLSVRLFYQGIACFQEVRDIVESKFGSDHLEVAETLKLLATVYSTVHDMNAAVKCYKDALVIESNHLGADNFELADTYSNLGRVYVAMNDLDLALECFEHGLKLAKNSNTTLTDAPLFIAESYNNIGRVYRLKKDFAKAIDAYNEASDWWKVQQPITANEAEKMARTLHSIALLYIEMEVWDKAIKMLQSALKQRQVYNTAELYPNNLVTNLFDLGLALDKAGKYNDAIHSFNELIDGITTNPKNCTSISNNISCILHNISICFVKKGDTNNAIATFRQVLQTTKATGWKLQSYYFFMESMQTFTCSDSNSMIRTFRNMGNILMNHKQHVEAIDWYKEVMTLQKNHLGAAHIEVAKTLKLIAFIYSIVQEYTKVIASYETALLIQKETCGEDSIDVAQTYNSLGIVHGMLDGHTDKSFSCFRKSLAIAKKVATSPSRFVAEIYYNIGMLNMKTNNVKMASDDFATALSMRKSYMEIKNDDRNKAELLPLLKSMGKLYSNSSHFEKAIDFYNEAIDMSHGIYSSEQIQANLHYNLGLTFVKCQKFEEATNHLQTALCIHQRVASTDTSIQVADILYHLGYAYSKCRKYSAALEYCRHAVEAYKSQFGNTHIQVANALFQLGDVLIQIGENRKERCLEAMQYYEESYLVRRLLLGEEHSEVASTLYYIGLLYLYRLKKYKKAIRSFSQCLNIFQKTDCSSTSYYCLEDSHVHLALAYQGNKEYGLALVHFQEALDIVKLSSDTPCKKTAEVYYKMGILHTCSVGKEEIMLSLSDAERYMKEALSCYRCIGLKDDSPCIQNILLWISYFNSESSSRPLPLHRNIQLSVTPRSKSFCLMVHSSSYNDLNESVIVRRDSC